MSPLIHNLYRAIIIATGLVITMMGYTEENKGVIGRVYEQGVPVIYKFVNELPPEETQKNLSWLTVISWRYDGQSNNGMPINDEYQRMITLEDIIEENLENDKLLRHVYSRTGNNLKELVYYIHDQDKFLAALNKTLKGHKRYPIEINFYKDPEWSDFKQLLSNFSKASKKKQVDEKQQ